jgi:hypothetical protein
VKTLLSNPGNIINIIKTGIKAVKNVKDIHDGKGVNFKDLLKVGKDNFLSLVNQALLDEVKTIQGTLKLLIRLKDEVFT